MIEAILAAGGGASTVDIIGLIAIPVLGILGGAIFGIIKGSIRFAQYMAHSEQTQDSIAGTNTEIRDQLNAYMEKTDNRLNTHDRQIAVLNYVLERNDGVSGLRIAGEQMDASHPPDK